MRLKRDLKIHDNDVYYPRGEGRDTCLKNAHLSRWECAQRHFTDAAPALATIQSLGKSYSRRRFPLSRATPGAIILLCLLRGATLAPSGAEGRRRREATGTTSGEYRPVQDTGLLRDRSEALSAPARARCSCASSFGPPGRVQV